MDYIKKNIWIISILFLACLLRFIGLSANPPALNWDEVSHPYNAYSILKTGTDEWGQIPLTNFRAYGDYPTPFNMYATVPFVAVLGLNEWSARLPTAVFGVFLCLIVYLLGLNFLKDKTAALLSALLVAVSPWTILTSRQTLQAVPAIVLLSFGIWLFLKSDLQKKWQIFSGTFFLGLSGYAYHNTRILAPIFLIVMLALFFKKIRKNFSVVIISLAIFGLMYIPVGLNILSGEAGARSVWVGIIDQGAINRINEQRNNSTLPGPLPKLTNNKVTYFITTSTVNYLGYFSPQYLGLSGGTQYQFSIPGIGLLNPLLLPLFYLGLVVLVIKFKKNNLEKKFLLLWLLISPLPAALTRDPYQVVRSITMIPAVFLTIGLGFQLIYNWLKSSWMKKTFIGMILISTLAFLFYFLYAFIYTYPKQYSQSWQYGYKQVASYLQQNQGQYSQIYITKRYGEPHEFLLFYNQIDPAQYKSDPNLVRYGRSDWFWVDRFGKYNFINDWEFKEKTKDKSGGLLITSPGNAPDNATKLETIPFIDGSPAFEIYQI